MNRMIAGQLCPRREVAPKKAPLIHSFSGKRALIIVVIEVITTYD
jgi:hypothetical protein